MKFLGKTLDPFKSISVVAEISCSHEQSLEQALSLIKIAKECGADAVKIQAYTPEEMTINAPQVDFICSNGPWAGKSLWELYNKTYTPLEWIPDLFECAERIKIPIFSSVFGKKSFEALRAVNCPVYKIASFEAGYWQLLELVEKTNKPILISTGVINSEELCALQDSRDQSGANFIFMHCVSKYPTPVSELNLTRLRYLLSDSDIVGFSDHTLSATAAQLAITMGATIIEKHLCTSSTTEDAKFALKPSEFKTFVQNCNQVLEAFKYRKLEASDLNYKRSIYAVKDIKQGELFTKDNIRVIRPGFGLPTQFLEELYGTEATCNLELGTALQKEHSTWRK